MQSSDAYPNIPPEAFLYFPKGDEIKNKSGRNFFDGNVEFDEDELAKIEKFKDYAMTHRYTLKPLWTDNMILRFLQANDFKMQKTLVSVKEYTTWKETCLPVKQTPKLLEFLNSGFLYVHGRDHKFRPIIVFNIYQLDPKTVDMELVTNALTFWLQYVIDEWMIPGQVEHWVFVINIKGMGVNALAYASVRKLFAYLQSNFKCRLYQIYLLNASPMIYTPWQIAKKFLDGDTTKKVEFYKSQIPVALFNHANREQVEVQFGGSAPNCTQFWPPIAHSNNYFVSQDDAKALVSREFYRSLSKKGSLKNTKISRSLIDEELSGSNQLRKSGTRRKKQAHSMTTSRIGTAENPNGNINPIFDDEDDDGYYSDDEKNPSTPSGNVENYQNDMDTPFDETDYVEYMSEKVTFHQEKGKIKEFRASFLLHIKSFA